MDIVALLKVLLRRKWYLIGIPILTVVATYFFTAGISPVYKSTASLATGFTTGDQQIQITEERINLRDAEIKFNNMIQTMNSETVLMLLSYRLILNDLTSATPFRKMHVDETHPELTAEEKKAAIPVYKAKLDSMQLLSNFNPAEAKLIDVLASYRYLNWQVKDGLEIKRVKDTDFVLLMYSSENPLLSAYVVNTLGEEYIRYDNSLKSNRSDQSVTFFERLAKEKKGVFDEKSEILTRFKSSQGGDFTIESETALAQIPDYEMRKQQMLSDLQRVNISIASINKKLNETGSEDNGSNDQATINSNIVRIREKIGQLNDEYIRTGSSNEELSKSISDLRYQLQVEQNKLTQTGTTTRATSRADLLAQREKFELEKQILEPTINDLTNKIYALKASIAGKGSKEATVEALQKEADKASDEYLQALDRYNTERNKSLVAGSSVRVIVKGQPNGYPELSKRYLIVVFSGIVAFCIAVFVIVFMEYIDIRVKNPQQFKKFVKVPLIGSINLIDSKNLNLFELFSTTTKDHSMEVFKHFLRKLRFEIESSKAKVILVTSTKPGEGKTFIILCMAYLLSMVQKKILIVDTNFKRNSLTQILLRKNENMMKLEQGIFIKGMIGEGKAHEMNEEDLASSIIYQTGHKGISIIGNNGGNESPSEIFAGRDFGSMLDRLRGDFDYIIMEGAALNNFSDTKELVGYADKVLPVFSAESVIKQLDRESIDYLKNLNGKLIGAVLNKISTKDLIL